MNIICTHLLIKKTVLYTTRTNLEKRIFHIRTSILLKIGGPLQLVVVLVLYWFVWSIAVFMYAFINALSGYNKIFTADINMDFEFQNNNFGNLPLAGKSRGERLESLGFHNKKLFLPFLFFFKSYIYEFEEYLWKKHKDVHCMNF